MRPRHLAWMLLALPFIFGGGPCDTPCPPEVRKACETCAANPSTPGCELLAQSKACDSCPAPGPTPTPTPPPSTTTTTTQPPVPPTTTTTTMPAPQPTPTPIPPLAGCRAPQGVEWSIGPVTSTRAKLVNEVMAGLTGCPVGEPNCVHGSGAGDAGAQKWMNRVIYELRMRGVCAGQHIAGSDELRQRRHVAALEKRAFSTGTDEIAVAVGACDGFWEGYKIANFGGGKVIWAIEGGGEGPPGANRRSWTPLSGCSATPPPTPSPSPGPTPTPEPSPGPACPIPGVGWFYDLKPHAGQQLDLTPFITNPTHQQNNPWPGCGVNRCPLSCEKGPVACACQRELFGDPMWETTGGPCNVFPPDPNSLMTVKVAQGMCKLFVHGSRAGAVSGSQMWAVQATVPACNVGPNGLCQ